MVELIKGLAAEIADALKKYRLHGDRDPPWGITIYQQYIPPERFDDEGGRYHPFVLVACRGWEEGEASTAVIGLTFGVYGEDDETWQDLLNLMETVRLRLLRRRIMAKRYRLIDDMTMEISEVQPAPFFYGQIECRYWMRQVNEEVGMLNGNV